MPASPAEQIARWRGLTLEQLAQEAEQPPEPITVTKVQDTPELRRILSLPRRPPPATDPAAQQLADQVTRYLARSDRPYPGPLRPIQAAALQELWQYGGVFGPIRAGYGKTLLAYLAPAIVGAQRPLYVCPANLREDVKREFARFAQHWRGPRPQDFRVLSYQTLGVESAGARHDAHGNTIRASLLDRLQPDLIVFDEAHKIKNKQAAVTRRVRRYLDANPGCRVIAMSGTMAKTSLKDYAHTARWCLPRTCPVPTVWHDVEAWADCLDFKTTDRPRVKVGALRSFCTEDEVRAIDAAERVGDSDAARLVACAALRRRLVETPGVVATQDGPLGIPLWIGSVHPDREDPQIAQAFEAVRTYGELPDGQPLVDGLDTARHARTLGLGFWLRWNPRPPEDWMTARRDWASWARDVIKHNRRGIDSELAVKQAVRSGLLNDHGLLARWSEQEPTFTPTTEAVWISNEVVEVAGAWAEQHPGIIWVQDVELGDRLSQVLKIPYYGEGGLDARKHFILDHPKRTPMIASKFANNTGRNLQFGWSENLLLCSPEEQLLARTHRDGQPDEHGARFWLYIGCAEHLRSFERECANAAWHESQFGQAQRLCYAEIAVEGGPGCGPRWEK